MGPDPDPPPSALGVRDLSAHRHLAKIVTLHVLVSVFWIFVSDELLETFIPDPETAPWVSIVKGWLFILVTTSLPASPAVRG